MSKQKRNNKVKKFLFTVLMVFAFGIGFISCKNAETVSCPDVETKQAQCVQENGTWNPTECICEF